MGSPMPAMVVDSGQCSSSSVKVILIPALTVSNLALLTNKLGLGPPQYFRT